MRKEEKIEKARALREIFQSNRYFIFFDFTGINVAQISNLRRGLRENGSSIRVIKNRVAMKAIKGTPVEEGKEWFQGPTAIAFAKDDVGRTIRELVNFSKETPLKFKGFILEGKKMEADMAEELGALPTREELLSKFASGMAAPLIQFGRALSMPIVLMGNAINEIKRKKEKGE